MIQAEFLARLEEQLNDLEKMCRRRGASRSILANIADVRKSIEWLKTQPK